jgi:hypothetical protein
LKGPEDLKAKKKPATFCGPKNILHLFSKLVWSNPNTVPEKKWTIGLLDYSGLWTDLAAPEASTG